MDDLRQTIGAVARASREALGMTQAQVAEDVGIATEVYGRLERGLMMPSVPTLYALARAIRVSPDVLLGWSSSSPPVRPELERLLTLVDDADPTTLRRVITVVEAVLGKG